MKKIVTSQELFSQYVNNLIFKVKIFLKQFKEKGSLEFLCEL